MSPTPLKSNDVRIYPEKNMESELPRKDREHILEWGHVPWKWSQLR